MAWYKSGTITVKKNSTMITGANTQWADAKKGVGPGQMLFIPGSGSVELYEIDSVDSNTQITLSTPYLGADKTQSAYAIITTYIDSVPDFARRLAAQLNYYQQQLDGWQDILTGEGEITLAAPDGTLVSLKSMAEISTVLSKLKGAALRDVGTLSGQVMEVGAFGLGGLCKNIPAADLNELNQTGFYMGSGLKNSPLAVASQWVYLIHMEHGNAGFSRQMAFSLGDATQKIWHRTKYSKNWTAWHELYHSGNKPTATDVAAISNSYLNPVVQTQNTGFYYNAAGGAGSDKAPTNASGWSYINLATSGHYRQRLAIEYTGINTRVFVQSIFGDTYNQWNQFWTSGNTTVDTNGFIKKASPIVKVFGDGLSELNDESQGVVVERLSEGVYRIRNSLGLAKEGWTLESPNSTNGLPLLWVDYDVTAEGVINLRTYHRMHPSAPPFAQNQLASYQDGDPIDIPAGRWIDLRVEMPVKDNPEVAAEPSNISDRIQE